MTPRITCAIFDRTHPNCRVAKVASHVVLELTPRSLAPIDGALRRRSEKGRKSPSLVRGSFGERQKHRGKEVAKGCGRVGQQSGEGEVVREKKVRRRTLLYPNPTKASLPRLRRPVADLYRRPVTVLIAAAAEKKKRKWTGFDGIARMIVGLMLISCGFRCFRGDRFPRGDWGFYYYWLSYESGFLGSVLGAVSGYCTIRAIKQEKQGCPIWALLMQIIGY
ncbi:hypothetical protein BHM03_00042140 [Ensete ventricosum]|nr:hypothetical protein BHM03_00042140 [Ensete ventricosum]